MKNNVLVKMTLWLLLIVMLLPMAACNQEQGTDDPTETEAEVETLPDPIDPASFGDADITYKCQDDSVLSTYAGKTAEDFAGVRSYYQIGRAHV